MKTFVKFNPKITTVRNTTFNSVDNPFANTISTIIKPISYAASHNYFKTNIKLIKNDLRLNTISIDFLLRY